MNLYAYKATKTNIIAHSTLSNVSLFNFRAKMLPKTKEVVPIKRIPRERLIFSL